MYEHTDKIRNAVIHRDILHNTIQIERLVLYVDFAVMYQRCTHMQAACHHLVAWSPARGRHMLVAISECCNPMLTFLI